MQYIYLVLFSNLNIYIFIKYINILTFSTCKYTYKKQAYFQI